MSNTIDCNVMSHSACEYPDPTAEPPSVSPAGRAPSQPAPSASTSSYDCVNDCASSLGVTTLVDGALASLGCMAVPVACPALIGVTVGSILGACASACEELEGPAKAAR